MCTIAESSGEAALVRGLVRSFSDNIFATVVFDLYNAYSKSIHILLIGILHNNYNDISKCIFEHTICPMCHVRNAVI